MAAYRATSLFQPHHTREAIRDAHEGRIPALLGLYLALSTVPTARLVAPLGFDAIWIDWEHSSCNVETMTTMVHEISFMSEGRTIPWVRVPGNDHAAIGFALDAGASVVIPQVNTVAEAQHAVSSAKFGTQNRGTRSVPPFRLITGFTDHPSEPNHTVHENLNRQAAIMIQIETVEAIDNLDAILTQVPDIDAVWLGTLDIRVSMGFVATGAGDPEPEYLQAVAKFESVLKKHDKPREGQRVGPPEIVKEACRDNSISFVATGAGDPEPEYLQAVAKFESVLKKHDKPRGGQRVGPPEIVKEACRDNSISFVAADALALVGLADVLPVLREAFPAQRKMVAAEEMVADGHAK